MKDIQELYAHIASSSVRNKILAVLEKGPLRPREISRKLNYETSQVSAALFQLQKKGMVKCLTPDKGSWRVYAITELGRKTLDYKRRLKNNSEKSVLIKV